MHVVSTTTRVIKRWHGGYRHTSLAGGQLRLPRSAMAVGLCTQQTSLAYRYKPWRQKKSQISKIIQSRIRYRVTSKKGSKHENQPQRHGRRPEYLQRAVRPHGASFVTFDGVPLKQTHLICLPHFFFLSHFFVASYLFSFTTHTILDTRREIYKLTILETCRLCLVQQIASLNYIN